MQPLWTSVRSNRDLEWGNAWTMTFLGLWLAAPWNAFSTSIFALIQQWGGEQLWGCLMAVSGIVHLFALLINGARWWTPLLRMVALMAGAANYAVFGVAAFAVAPGSLSVACVIVLLAWTLAVIHRAAVDAIISKARRNAGLPA